MTDNKIIKALDWLVEQMGVCSSDDAYIYGHILLCHFNRQKAEIKRLQGHNENLRTANVALSNEIFEIKAEAIKEFADRLKVQKYQSSDWSHGEHPFVVEESDIDELVQEMVGDENG